MCYFNRLTRVARWLADYPEWLRLQFCWDFVKPPRNDEIALQHFFSLLEAVQEFFTGLPYGKPSRKIGRFPFFFFLVFFSVSVKVLPVTPLVSGVFVHRAFCAYFPGIERVVELRRFLWWTQ